MLYLCKKNYKMEETKKKLTWGGKRENAGRNGNGKPTQMISFRIEKRLLEKLPPEENRSKYLNDCVRERLKKIRIR